MKAFVYREYGPPSVLRIETLDDPTPGDGDVVVKIRAASVNPMDYGFMKGMYLMRPFKGMRRPRKLSRPGVDFSGEVTAIGKTVTRFKPGDRVFGVTRGAFADYGCTTENRLALMGNNLAFSDAAAIPVAGLTALQ